jgi:hypothetical protein
MDDFAKLTERLKREKIPFNVYNTGGGCEVLFISFPDKSELSITPTEEECSDPTDAWMVCDNANPEAFWEGESVTLDECATTDRVVEMVRQRQRGLKIIEIIAGPEDV